MILYQNDNYNNDSYPTIVSFFTKNWEYSKYAKKMKNSCQKLNLNYYIKELKPASNWLKNTKLKTDFILETIQELKRPILWIDVDGSIYKKPEMMKLPIKYDFMAKKKPKTHSRTWHVGTMFFNYNDRVLNFVRDWKEYCDQMNGSDELALEHIWENTFNKYNIKYSDIPKTYFKMLNSQNNKESTDVIVHRASKDASKLEMKRRRLI